MNQRIFAYGDKKAIFNKEGFKFLCKDKCLRDKIRFTKLEKQLAAQLGVADNTVHKWYYGANGPIDMDTINRLAEALEVKEVTLLLKFVDEGENEMIHLSERQVAAVKRIYDVCIWFLHEFKNSDGFSEWWLSYKLAGSKDPTADTYDKVEAMEKKIQLVLDQEYFDLRNCSVYNDLCEFVCEDLINAYDGKVSAAYRSEAAFEPDSAKTSTATDFDKAMIRLNTIIDRYT